MNGSMDDKFLDYIEGVLSEEERRAFEQALQDDPALRRSLEQYRKIVQLEQTRAQTTAAPGPALTAAIMSQIDALPEPWHRRLAELLRGPGRMVALTAVVLMTVTIAYRAWQEQQSVLPTGAPLSEQVPQPSRKAVVAQAAAPPMQQAREADAFQGAPTDAPAPDEESESRIQAPKAKEEEKERALQTAERWEQHTVTGDRRDGESNDRLRQASPSGASALPPAAAEKSDLGTDLFGGSPSTKKGPVLADSVQNEQSQPSKLAKDMSTGSEPPVGGSKNLSAQMVEGKTARALGRAGVAESLTLRLNLSPDNSGVITVLGMTTAPELPATAELELFVPPGLFRWIELEGGARTPVAPGDTIVRIVSPLQRGSFSIAAQLARAAREGEAVTIAIPLEAGRTVRGSITIPVLAERAAHTDR